MHTPTTGHGSSSAQRRLGFIVAVLAAIGGALALTRPFLPIGGTWAWRIESPVDLERASVNAELVSVDERGAQLIPQPNRPISLITPPLALPANAESTVFVEAAYTGAGDGRRRCIVRLLWQAEAQSAYRYVETSARLSADTTRIAFSLPDSPEKIHRLGVQFPEVDGPIFIRSVAIPSLSFTERISLFAGQAGEREPFRAHSMNFLRGPVMLGHGLNYYLIALIALAGGGYVAVRLRLSQRVDARVMIGIFLLAWLLSDGQATANLDRNIALDVRDFAGKSREGQIAFSEGEDIAWAWQRLVAECPEGGTYAVVSDDPFRPAHRLAYLLAPLRTRVEDYASADFIVVIASSGARFDELGGVFSLREGPEAKATLIDRASDQLYLLRRESR